MSAYPLSPAAPIQVEAEPNSGLSITRRGLKTIVGWLPGFGPGGNAGGGGPSLPAGGGIGQVLKILSLNPFKVGWAEDNIAVINGSNLSFGQTAGTATEGNDPRVVGAMQKAQNGADIPDKGAFRTNLNLGGAASLNAGVSGGVAMFDDGRLTGAMQKSANGSDIADRSAFRGALGLKAAALLDVGATGGVASYDDPRFGQGQDISGKVDKANPQMAAPPFVTFPAPALVSSVPQSAIDQYGVLCLGHLGVDLTGASAVDVICQRALDAIATRIANSGGGGDRRGGTLLFPHGSRARFQTGLVFNADGPISIIGGTGKNRNSAWLYQECDTLFDLTNTTSGAEGGSAMLVELGGLFTVARANNCQQYKIFHPEAVHAHDLRHVAGSGYSRAFMNLRNVRTSNFERFYLRNDHGLGTVSDVQGIAFNMTATVGSTDNRFDNMTVQGFDIGFNANSTTKPTIEGTICTGLALLCNTGIIWVYNGPAGYTPPQFHYLNGHMNCQKSWFKASNVADIVVADCQLELHNEFGYFDSGLEFTGVERFGVHDNFMGMARASSLLVTAGNSNLGHFHDNHGIATGTSAAIQIINPSRNINCHDNCFAMTGGNIWNGDAARNNQNINNTVMLNG